MRGRQQIEKVAMRQREEKRKWTAWRGTDERPPSKHEGASQDQTKESEKRDLLEIKKEWGRMVSGERGEGKAKEEGGKTETLQRRSQPA
jgi:hypothetical protein